MKQEAFSLAKILQGDFFPNRETVGTENEVVMIGRFEAVCVDKETTPAHADDLMERKSK